MNEKSDYVDLIAPRNKGGIFKFMTRPWTPQKTVVLDKKQSPQNLKKLVSNSVYLDLIMDKVSAETGARKDNLKKEVYGYLEEISLDKKMHVVRWMGVIFLKICFMMKIGVFVNETKILKLKSVMGQNPILFLPTHRSYADFCLMTYLCYHYDIELPAVAAGMDFYSMAVLGQLMRETSAFYIRRTLIGAPLYAATLRQYVRTLVAEYPSPVEFFLEGTRSRSNKSLPPKYGMLSMSLLPFFSREISDITIVPVNISYERIVEQSLFAYEHLGAPKPRESTGGFLRSLSNLNDFYGNIYINIGDPISVRELTKNCDNTCREISKPIELQELTPEQFTCVQEIANKVVSLHQKYTTVTAVNLVALVMSQCLMMKQALNREQVLAECEWMMQILKNLGATVLDVDVNNEIDRILIVHKKLLHLDGGGLRLVTKPAINLTEDLKGRTKGHRLEASTIENAIPVIEIQLYINPLLHYLMPPALICLILKRSPILRDQLENDFNELRKLLKYEIFYLENDEKSTLEAAINFCATHNLAVENKDVLESRTASKLTRLLEWCALPALATLHACIQVMKEVGECSSREACALAQARDAPHPYCRSVLAAAACLRGLHSAGALAQVDSKEITYRTIPHVMDKYDHLIASVLPTFSSTCFNEQNPAIFYRGNSISKL